VVHPEFRKEKTIAPQINEPESDYFVEQEMTVERQLKKLLEQRPEDFSKVVRALLQDEEA
jgi:flagellar M-ring protein FliF